MLSRAQLAAAVATARRAGGALVKLAGEHPRVTAAAIAALVMVALAGGWWRDHARLAADLAVARQRAEAAELKQKGVIAAARVAEAAAAEQLEALKRESAEFRAAAERAAAAAKPRPVLVARLSTEPQAAGGEPRPTPAQAGPPAGDSLPPAGAACPLAPPCLLALGDPGRIICRVAGVRAELGTLAVFGDSDARRVDPDGSEHVILRGSFSERASSVEEVADVGASTPATSPASILLHLGALYRAQQLAPRPDLEAGAIWRPLPFPLELHGELALLPDNTLDARAGARLSLRIR
jgi:hypothetical protein